MAIFFLLTYTHCRTERKKGPVEKFGIWFWDECFVKLKIVFCSIKAFQQHLSCVHLQKNHPYRAGTHWTVRGSRRRRLDLCGSHWLFRSRKASGSSSRTGRSVVANERPSWQKNKLKSETVYAPQINVYTLSRDLRNILSIFWMDPKSLLQVTLVSPTDSKGSGSTSPSSKPQTPEEPKRPESLLGKFERREHLKKANTLPSSVTGKIVIYRSKVNILSSY